MSGLVLMRTPSGRSWQPCRREYAGNMCGIYLEGLPPVPGGRNPALVLSWFYDRYGDADRARIRQAWRVRGLTDVLVSWPDSRAVGRSPQQFGATCDELYQAGFEPCVFLTSKDYDPSDLAGLKRTVAPVLPILVQRVGRVSVGWELNLFMSPETLQAFRNWLAPQIVPWGGKLYVHFSEGVASWQIDGHPFAAFWNDSIGQLTGILHQRKQTGTPDDPPWDPAMYQARLADILDRFAGQYFCSPDSGFGHPFDCIALEITAMDAYNRDLSEAEQNAWAVDAVTTPASHGPFGPVRVMGAGNGVA